MFFLVHCILPGLGNTEDPEVDLSKVIPLRLYGDGCEATRALLRNLHCRNEHLTYVLFT